MVGLLEFAHIRAEADPLGSTVKELTAAYHGLKKEHHPAVDLYTRKGPKESATVFTIVENQVTEILIEAHPRG